MSASSVTTSSPTYLRGMYLCIAGSRDHCILRRCRASKIGKQSWIWLNITKIKTSWDVWILWECHAIPVTKETSRNYRCLIIIIIMHEFQSDANRLPRRLQGRCHVSCGVHPAASPHDRRNSSVFSALRNWSRDGEDVIDGGRPFQTFAAVTGKAWSPMMLCFDRGTCRYSLWSWIVFQKALYSKYRENCKCLLTLSISLRSLSWMVYELYPTR